MKINAIAETRKLITSGISESAVVTQIRIKWNLPQADAERLYAAARRGASTPASSEMSSEGNVDLIWGLGALALGGIATAFMWIFAEVVASYSLTIGVMLYGVYRIAKGLLLKYRASSNTRAIYVWSGVAVVMAGSIVTAGVLVFTSEQIAGPSEIDFVWEQDESFLISDDTIRFSGRIENRNETWTVVDPEMTVSMYNSAGLLVGERTRELELRPVSPGQSSRYSIDITLLERFETYDTEINWDWKR